uniref:Cytochrome P450 CYP9Z20v3 n=1 Tax=Dendroctonus valens TaxID=77173 RepID=M1NJY9_DENVA|nr:cytochrome P450 CYP9Z20v3 [Dendroctonus valens]
MFWLLFISIAILLISYHYVKNMHVFNRKGVKQTTPWPLFGDQWRTFFRQQSRLEHIEYIYNMYPNERYSGFYQFSVPTLMLKDPELIKQITVKDFDHFTDHRAAIDPELDPLFARNLFTLKGLRWRQMGSTLSGSFTSSKMKNMFSLMDEAAEHFTNFFLNQNKETIEIEMKDTYSRFTNDVIATTAFGIKVDSLEETDNVFYSMGKDLTNFNSFIGKLRILGIMLAPKLFKALKIGLFPAKFKDFFTNVIYETIETREKQGIVRQDMIHLLMEARKGIEEKEQEVLETGFATVKETPVELANNKQIGELTNLDIAAQAMIFFFAGFDAISTVMCFGTYELAVNQDVQDKLRKEILATHKANNGKLSYDSLLKMKYMDMVVSEMLRKWPAGPGIDRVTTKPYTIEPVRPGEKPVHLIPGDVLFLPTIGLHRDPAFYPNPMKFDPERFSDENKGNIIPYTYTPFGAGPRNCIGSRFALLEIKALFYHVLLNFKIEPTEKTLIPLVLCTKSFNSRAKGGFWYLFKRINNASVCV